MPNKNGTGPEGKGPKTGRQMGNCKDAEPTQDNGNGFGRRNNCNRRGFQGRRCQQD